MLVEGSFQAEVAPREFVYTLKNYQTAYASEYTYSTFRNSLIFARGSAALSFMLGTMLAWLTERTNTPLRGNFCAPRRGAVDFSRSAGVDRLDIFVEPEVRLSQRLVKKSVRLGRRAVQCLFPAGNDLGSFRGTGAVGVSA